jgi:choice-of-anchor A domain-containing protein
MKEVIKPMRNLLWNRQILLAIPFSMTLLAGGLMPAQAYDLGPATKYNVFVFGDMNQSSDSEGRVAVGGNATFSNFGIADRLQTTDGPNLVVGGNLNYQGGQVFGGNAVYGGSANIQGAGIPNGSFSQGQAVNFQAAEQELTGLSSTLSKLSPTNSTTYHNWGGIQLDGRNSDMNVFELDGAKFSSTNNFVLNAPAGSTVVVNVKGDNVSLRNFGMQFNGVSKNNVIFNFVDATNISSTGFSFQGSVLAPKAHYSFNNGNLEGTLIAKSVAGNGEFHHYPFQGTLPEPPASTEPGTGTSGSQPDTEPSNPTNEEPTTPGGDTPSTGENPDNPSNEQPTTPGGETGTPSTGGNSDDTTEVPEPSTIAGLLLGTGFLGGLRRKMKRTQKTLDNSND